MNSKQSVHIERVGKLSYDIEGNESGWGNNEAQNYTYKDMDNAIVDNGILKIIAQSIVSLGFRSR